MRTAIFFLAAATALSACNSVKPLGDTDGADTVPLRVQQAFEETCAIDGCHDTTTQAQGLSLAPADSASILGGPASLAPIPLVTLGDVCQSFLAIKLLTDDVNMCETKRVGAIMPSTGRDEPENQENVAIILGWIAGAEFPGGETDGTGTGTGSGTTGGQTRCGLDDVSMGVSSPVEAGDLAGMIPTEIGAVFDGNCGCHLVDDEMAFTAPGFVRYTGSFEMRTYAALNATSASTSCDSTNLDCLEGRVLNVSPPTMPLRSYCSEQDVGAFAQADFDALKAWLEAGAPDGANWPP